MLRERAGRVILSCWRSTVTGRRGLAGTAPRSARQLGAAPDGGINFSFSGCGWLTPWHWGVADAMMGRGLLTPESRVAGASGGSLAAATVAAGVPIDVSMESYRRQANLCRKHGTIQKIEPILREELAAVLTEGGVKAMSGRGTVAVTRLRPRPIKAPVLVDTFSDADDLIGALLSSCHIPFYLSPKASQQWRGGSYIDGGFGAIMPPIEGYVGVMPFLQRYIPAPLTRGFVRSRLITPDLTPGFPFYMHQVLYMAAFPSSDERITQLFRWGFEAGNVWADKYVEEQKARHEKDGRSGMMGG